MEKSYSISLAGIKPAPIVLDIILLAFIYFIPAISHLFAFPVYFLEPMRIAVFAALLFTNKKNTYLIALTIPIFSFIIASHPSMIKASLLAVELLLNVALFFYIYKKLENVFPAAIISILLSKIIYYTLKYMLLQYGVMSGSLISTPVYYQGATAIVYSIIIFLFYKEQNK